MTAVPITSLAPAILGRIAVELPEFLEDVEVFFVFHGIGIKSVGVTVATTPDDGILTADLSESR
jgi:hypothetical protein